MRYLYFILCSLLFIASVSTTIEAQSLMQTAKKAEQRAKELKEQENTRYGEIVDSRDLKKYEVFINDYPKSQNTHEIRKRANEIKMWNDAKVKHSIAAYEGYINSTQYHWFDIEAKMAIEGIKKTLEKKAWERVTALNTIEAYQQYLNENPSSGYRLEAESAINRIKEANAWNKVKNTTNIEELEDYVKAYPKSEHIGIVTARLYELKGVKFYNDGDLSEAYKQFSNLQKDQIAILNRQVYDAVMEDHEYQNLGDYATEVELLRYIGKYPNGRYYREVSNKIAIAKARNFGAYTSETDYVRSLSYSQDEETKKEVQSYIAKSKKLKAYKEKAAKSIVRKQNGGSVNFGLDFLDIGFNGNQDAWYYNFGLILRFGNFKDWVQFAVGVKPGFITYSNPVDIDSYYYDDETSTNFHLPLIAQLKLNLLSLSDNSRFFVYGKYQYNAGRIELVEGEMAWGIGCGFAWKHFDWAFYYRKDIDRMKYKDFSIPNFWGMSMIYYWQL